MNKNVKIAKELLKLANELMTEKTNVWGISYKEINKQNKRFDQIEKLIKSKYHQIMDVNFFQANTKVSKGISSLSCTIKPSVMKKRGHIIIFISENNNNEKDGYSISVESMGTWTRNDWDKDFEKFNLNKTILAKNKNEIMNVLEDFIEKIKEIGII